MVDFVFGREGLRTARNTIEQDSFEIQGQRRSSDECHKHYYRNKLFFREEAIVRKFVSTT